MSFTATIMSGVPGTTAALAVRCPQWLAAVVAAGRRAAPHVQRAAAGTAQAALRCQEQAELRRQDLARRRQHLMRSLPPLPRRCLAIATGVGAVVLTYQAVALVPAAPSPAAAARIEASAPRSPQRTVTALSAKLASAEGLMCAQQRQKLWSEERGWVVRRVSICR